MIRLSSDSSITSFSASHPPVAEVSHGESFVCETHDCYAGQIYAESVTRPDIDMSDFNRATGPVAVADVQAGDWIRIEIESIVVKSPGVMALSPGLGLLGDTITRATTRLVPVLGAKAWITDGIGVEITPMVGVLGVAPIGDPVPTGWPGAHGGNLDTRLLSAGSAFIVRAMHDGALVSVGDLHAAQGDGELGGTGIEVAGEVQLRIEHFDHFGKLPLVRSATDVSVIASAVDLEEATRSAFAEGVELMRVWHNLNWEDAYRLASIVGRAEISQVVNPLVTARFAIPREWAPAHFYCEETDE